MISDSEPESERVAQPEKKRGPGRPKGNALYSANCNPADAT